WFNFSFILDSLRTEKKDSVAIWKINCNNFKFNNSQIYFNSFETENNKHFIVNKLNIDVSDFSNYADSTAFKINKLTLNYNNEITVNQFAADFKIVKGNISVNALNMKTEKSEINDLNLLLQIGKNETVLNENLDFDAKLTKSTIKIAELAEIFRGLQGIDQSIDISGRIYGNLNDIKGTDLLLQAGSNTIAAFDFYINGIHDIETMYLFLDLKQLETTSTDISDFSIIRNGKKIQLKIPEYFYDSGNFSFKGNFSGFLSDF